jgi:hypothetical protein
MPISLAIVQAISIPNQHTTLIFTMGILEGRKPHPEGRRRRHPVIHVQTNNLNSTNNISDQPPVEKLRILRRISTDVTRSPDIACVGFCS